MDRLAAGLAALVERGAAFSAIPPQIIPIESSAGTPIQAFRTDLIVGADGGITLEGERIAGIGALKERLEMELAWMRRDGRIRPLHVWTDRLVPASRFAKIAAAAPEGLEVRLAFAASEREPTRRSFGPCRASNKASKSSTAPPTAKSEALRRDNGADDRTLRVDDPGLR